jgi:hypothetical protein
MTDYQSPVIMEKVLKELPGDEKGSLYEMAEVRDALDDKLLATCMMSDDIGLEGIADALSAKRLPREANRFRQMVMDSRRRK